MPKLVDNSWGGGGVIKDPLERKTLGGGGGQMKESSMGGGVGYEYFLEAHIAAQ